MEVPPIPDRVRHQRTKLIKLALEQEIDCQALCSAVGISTHFLSILKACQLYLRGKDDKAERFCRGAVSELTEEELEDMRYELVSVVQAYVQESVQWTSQSRKIPLFETMSENVGTSGDV